MPRQLKKEQLLSAARTPPDAAEGLDSASALVERRGSLPGTGPQGRRRLGWLTEALPGRLSWAPMSTVSEQGAAGLHRLASAGSGAAGPGERAAPAGASRLSDMCSSARQRAASAASSSAPVPRSAASRGSPAGSAAAWRSQPGRREKACRPAASAKRCSLVLTMPLVLPTLAGAAGPGLAAGAGGRATLPAGGGGGTGATRGLWLWNAAVSPGLLAPTGCQVLLPGISRSVGRRQARCVCNASACQQSRTLIEHCVHIASTASRSQKLSAVHARPKTQPPTAAPAGSCRT